MQTQTETTITELGRRCEGLVERALYRHERCPNKAKVRLYDRDYCGYHAQMAREYPPEDQTI